MTLKLEGKHPMPSMQEKVEAARLQREAYEAEQLKKAIGTRKRRPGPNASPGQKAEFERTASPEDLKAEQEELEAQSQDRRVLFDIVTSPEMMEVLQAYWEKFVKAKTVGQALRTIRGTIARGLVGMIRNSDQPAIDAFRGNPFSFTEGELTILDSLEVDTINPALSRGRLIVFFTSDQNFRPLRIVAKFELKTNRIVFHLPGYSSRVSSGPSQKFYTIDDVGSYFAELIANGTPHRGGNSNIK